MPFCRTVGCSISRKYRWVSLLAILNKKNQTCPIPEDYTVIPTTAHEVPAVIKTSGMSQSQQAQDGDNSKRE